MQRIGRYFDIEFDSIIINPRQPGSQISVLELYEPGIHFLLGKNGSGKSRLINSLSAFSTNDNSAFDVSVIGKLPSHEKINGLTTAIEEFVPDVNSITPPEIQRFEFANPTLLNCVIDSFWDCRRVYKDPFTFFSEREILEVFGFPKDEIDRWERYFRLKIEDIKDDGLLMPGEIEPSNLKESFSLSDHKCQIFLAWLSSSTINFQDNYHYPVPLTDSTPWIDSPENVNQVLQSFLEFIDNISHIEVKQVNAERGKKSQHFRLLATPPLDGQVAQILKMQKETIASLQKSVDSTMQEKWPDSNGNGFPFSTEVDVGFPFDFYYQLSGLSENFIASISIPLREDLLVEKFFEGDYKILDFHDPSKEFPYGIEESLQSHLSQLHEISTNNEDSDDEVSFTVKGFEKSASFLKNLSMHISKAQIGISQITQEKLNFHSGFLSKEVPENFSLKPKLYLVDSQSKEKFPFSSASSGQLDVITILFWLLTIETENCLIAIATLDEFDRHLQSSAAERLLSQINELSREKNLVSIVSTHRVPQFSSSLIRQRPRIFAHRNLNDQPVFTNSESIPTEIAVELLGVHANEALNLKKVRLLIEGPHDALVIKHLIETSAGIQVEDIDFVSALGTQPFNSLWQNRFTRDDIPLLVVYDKRNLELERAFHKAQELSKKPDIHDRIWQASGLAKIAMDLRNRKNQNERAKGDYELTTLMSLIKNILGHKYTTSHGEHWNTCYDLNSLRKVEIFGLDCDDIVDLLDISAFPQAAQYGNWKNAHAKVNASNGLEFKNKLHIYIDSIEQAIKSDQHKWHPELIRLLNSISRYSSPLTDPSAI
jgi:energy-coupling factor transporter ATP-binding protein EcfA2